MRFIILLHQDDSKLLPSLRAEGEGPGERPAPVLRVGEAEADDADDDDDDCDEGDDAAHDPDDERVHVVRRRLPDARPA